MGEWKTEHSGKAQSHTLELATGVRLTLVRHIWDPNVWTLRTTGLPHDMKSLGPDLADAKREARLLIREFAADLLKAVS